LESARHLFGRRLFSTLRDAPSRRRASGAGIFKASIYSPPSGGG
jgi:hypothetical protein